ncbi:hypothetical protein D3C84_1257050 [compost metagenome]
MSDLFEVSLDQFELRGAQASQFQLYRAFITQATGGSCSVQGHPETIDQFFVQLRCSDFSL